jgi:hypothetical protein
MFDWLRKKDNREETAEPKADRRMASVVEMDDPIEAMFDKPNDDHTS